jgi:predicted 3-demethylubiquinone-9 3-methyltransferase (glyoxalase superfamily)
MQKIIPYFWFDKQAEEAAEFYTSIFNNSGILDETRYTDEGKEIHGMDAGTVMTIDFELAGQRFIALNGGPHFEFNPSISFFVQEESETDVNRLWDELLKGGQVMMPLDTYPWSEKYGWLQDRFGLTWQISLGKKEDTGGQIITPSLMFTGEQYGRAEEAINHYTSIFKNTGVDGILRFGRDESPDTEGNVKHAQFQLEGQTFMIMESAHEHNFGFNEAISFVVSCSSAEEVDDYWDKLKEGGDPKAQQCGWLKDTFGVSWQVVPEELITMLKDGNPEKVRRVTAAMLRMKKIDLPELQHAFNNK